MIQVEEMAAGRELDICIAEVVTGRSRLEARVDPCNRDGEPQFYWGYPVGHDFAPNYSSDLGEAMRLALKLMERRRNAFWFYSEHDERNGKFYVRFENFAAQHTARGETLELAISRAAYKVLSTSDD